MCLTGEGRQELGACREPQPRPLCRGSPSTAARSGSGTTLHADALERAQGLFPRCVWKS